MAIPVYLQQFKAAGIYRVVFDKSTVMGVDSEILRLVVGYSEQGPFNIPTYVTSISDFKAIYGDISKKLERRGCFFHRMAIQALGNGPILCLNLKKFDDETVYGSTISTSLYTDNTDPIDTVELNVEDIYDTSRFWELSAEKLNDLKSASGSVLDQYINICTTNTKQKSASYFIRKASGTAVNGYKVTVSDWYNDESTDVPDFLENNLNNYISDFMAEVYVFNGEFVAEQVMASTTLKNYFEVNDKNELVLKPYITDAFGDKVDTLDALYNDATSGALGHYVGSLIPEFKDKNGSYNALDILFNTDIDTHNMMMSFNVDKLYEGDVTIDLSGRTTIGANETGTASTRIKSALDKLVAGTTKVNILGNIGVTPVIETINYGVNIGTITDEVFIPNVAFSTGKNRISGTFVLTSAFPTADADGAITLTQLGEKVEVEGAAKQSVTITFNYTAAEAPYIIKQLDGVNQFTGDVENPSYDALFAAGKVITAITHISDTNGVLGEVTEEYSAQSNVKFYKEDVETTVIASDVDSVFGSSISLVAKDEQWNVINVEDSFMKQLATDLGATGTIYASTYNDSLISVLNEGDCILAVDDTVEPADDDNAADNVYVSTIGSEDITIDDVTKTVYYVVFTADPYEYAVDGADTYFVRIDAPIAQEIGTMKPVFLKGYTYANSKPESTSMKDKLTWQKFQLSALEEYKGLRTGLLNKSDIDYRYIVDTFETYVDGGAKKVLSYLAKEKQSAFAILNFPSVRTFVKCPYTSFTDSKGIFNVQYVVDGYNKKKKAGTQFSLPTDAEGASFCAFYTPLKFSDGYIDTIVPAAGLVSNLFMEKYMSRQPYYIIAGPNYGAITASNLVGPDYNYSQDELQIIEPYGVNCMVYRPSFGTFINANQTAKQTPKSALSSVNVRELVIYLQDEIEKVLQAYQWEFNNQTTRNAILDKANSICARVQANGGIQQYLNVMDESNNTPEIIDNEMAILSTHIEPGRGCGKMVQELTLYRTGQMASTILE